MRIGILMRDREYRDALIEVMSESDKDIFVEIADRAGAGRESVILTDISPEEIGKNTLQALIPRTLFLTTDSSCKCSFADKSDGIYRAFKYSSIPEIIAEAADIYYRWTGHADSISPLTMSIAVCSVNDAAGSFRCRSLARQLLYRKGGSILILPLSFINDYSPDTSIQKNSDAATGFKRMMYYIDSDREFSIDEFIYTDSYGISYLNMPRGLNPVSELSEEHLNNLVNFMGHRFDSLILDVSVCYRRENISLIGRADSILFFSGSRIEEPCEIVGKENAEHLYEIREDGVTDTDISIAEYLNEFIGRDDRDEGSNAEIFAGDRDDRKKHKEKNH